MRGTQITPGVPVRAAERHGQECRLLRHPAIQADIIENTVPEADRPKLCGRKARRRQ